MAALDALRERSLLGGGPARIEQQHARGKLTAANVWTCCWTLLVRRVRCVRRPPRIRLRTRRPALPGRRRGHRARTIDGRVVFVFSQDFTVFGGSLSEAHAEKSAR
jgi:propionyl-CoA carboxylase beta chain